MSLPRKATPTVRFIDEYCEYYSDLFKEVRSYESFKYLHLGMISEIKRKSLPAIAKAVGMANGQPLHHFIANSPWDVEQLRKKRIDLLKQVLSDRKFTLCIDETGDKKKGKRIDKVSDSLDAYPYE